MISPNRKSEEHKKWHYRGKRGGRRKPKRVKEFINGINSSNLLYPPRKPISRDSGWKLKLATINTRSIRNKTGIFLDHIIDNSIDICTITETWLKDKDEVTRAELNIDGYVLRILQEITDKGVGLEFLIDQVFLQLWLSVGKLAPLSLLLGNYYSQSLHGCSMSSIDRLTVRLILCLQVYSSKNYLISLSQHVLILPILS